MSVPSRLRPALRSVVEELVRGNYLVLEQDGRAGRVGAQGLKRAIEEYGCHLIDLPEEAFEISNPIPASDRPGAWHVDLDLRTVEEERSDLTISMTVIDTGDDVQVEIDDCHVL